MASDFFGILSLIRHHHPTTCTIFFLSQLHQGKQYPLEAVFSVSE